MWAGGGYTGRLARPRAPSPVSFLALSPHRSELVAIRSDGLKFITDGALKGMIRKSKTDEYGERRL